MSERYFSDRCFTKKQRNWQQENNDYNVLIYVKFLFFFEDIKLYVLPQ